MPNIFHQSIEDILNAATPEQRLMWNYIFLRWGDRVPISQFFYQGTLVGSQLSVYSANKLYIAYELIIAGQNTPQIAQAYTQLYDETNAVFFIASINSLMWDVTAAAARYFSCTDKVSNCIFSRLGQGGIPSYIKFTGYRIAI